MKYIVHINIIYNRKRELVTLWRFLRSWTGRRQFRNFDPPIELSLDYWIMQALLDGALVEIET